MPTLQTAKNRIYPIDLSRDECVVIDHRAGNPDAFKKAWAKMKRILKDIPVSNVDTLKELKKTRESSGRL